MISDGLHVDATFAPTLQINGNGYVLAQAGVGAANYDVSCNYSGGPGPECSANDPAADDGTTSLTFRVSDEIISRGQNGRLVGGCVNPATGSNPPDCSIHNDGSTTGTIIYRAVIQDQFTDDYPSGDASVDQGDELSNSVTITGTVLNNTDFTTTGNPATDTSGASENVPRDQLSKDFYAINGDTNLNHFKVDSKIHIKPGDVLTYELKYELATSDVEDLYLMDYLPLPIFDVDDPDADGTTGPAWTFSGKCGGATPAAGEACFGGDDTFFDYSTITPALASDVDGDGNPDDESNTLRFYYGDFDSPSNQAKTIHILFSVAVNTEPFADGLYLTNQVHVHEGSTNATAQDTESIINFVLDEPSLVHKKSVIASDNVNASITPALSGYTFTSPGSAGLRWTSPAKISSDYLNSHALNSDINGIDGGDLVSFAIVIENQGHSGGGAYDITIQDTIPAELQVPSAGYNLVIYYGDGSGPINYAKPDGSPATPVDLFGGGIQLVDPAGQGVCQSHDPNLGNNIIILTYDLQVIPGIAPDATLENEGTITNYSNVEGGDDFTGSGGSGQEGDLKDKATINITDPAVSKNITATSIDTTGSSQHNAALEDLTIGEEVTFEIVVTIPEGQSHPVTVTDNLPTSPTGVLSVVSSCITSIGASLSADSGTLPADRCPDSFGTHKNTDGDAYYDQVVFEFGNVNNTANGVVNDGDRIYLQVVARVEGHVDNQDGDVLANSVRVTAGAVTQSGSRDFEIVQPDLEITKTDYGDYFFSGGLLIYELTYQNNGTGTALGVTISDSVPIGTTFVAGSSSTGWVLPGTTTACPDSAAAGTVCEYPVGTLAAGAAAQTVNFAVRVDDPLSPAVTQIRNTARIDDQFAVDDMDNTNDSATDDDELANLGKSLVDTNQTFTLGQDVAIGEILTYRLVLFLPPHASGSGQMPVLTITDNLDAGLAFVDCLSVTPSSTNLTTDLTGDFADACSPNAANPTSGNPAIYPIPQTGAGSAADVNQGRQIVFDLGTVTNNGSVNETLTIEYRVAVLDSVDTLRGVNLNNAATALWGQHGTRNEATAMATDAMIVEPWYYLIKRADQTVVFKGATITFTLEVGHRAESDADGFDLVLTDPLPGSLHYVSGSLRIASGWNDGGNVVLNDSNPQKLRIAWDNFPLGQTSNVEFKAVLDRRAQESVENTAYLAWTSLPGDVTAAQSVFNPLSTERFYDPPSTVDIYGAFNSIIITIRGSRLPDTGYPPGEITVIEPDIDAKPYGLNDSIWLDIPTRQVHVPIVGIPLTEQGWNLTWLLEQAGYLGGTAYPTWPGNTVLTAHAYLPDGSSGPFMAIDQLKWGDSILLRTHDATYLYEVRQNYYVKANDLSPLYSSDGYDWLTLITCYQYDENIGGYRWRTVVRAVLMDVIDHVLDSVSP